MARQFRIGDEVRILPPSTPGVTCPSTGTEGTILDFQERDACVEDSRGRQVWMVLHRLELLGCPSCRGTGRVVWTARERLDGFGLRNAVRLPDGTWRGEPDDTCPRCLGAKP